MKTKGSVGYCKPPKAFQFKKGQSGNLKGRPRRPQVPLSPAFIFRKVASELISVEGEGGARTMTRFEALLSQIYAMTLTKDPHAARLLDQLRREFPGTAPTGDPTILVFSDDDMAIL
jgi:hypothetical protein